MTNLFTEKQINRLRIEFSRIDRIDPCLPTYPKMIKLLDSMSQAQLRQVRYANIRFLSKLALNRLPIEAAA